jgi:hypothetical protein
LLDAASPGENRIKGKGQLKGNGESEAKVYQDRWLECGRKKIPIKNDRVYIDLYYYFFFQNCFYRTGSRCLTGTENNHLLMREIVCLWIRLNPEDFEGFTADIGDDASIDDYLRWVSRATRDAGQLEAVAFSWASQVVVNIKHSTGHDFQCNGEKT